MSTVDYGHRHVWTGISPRSARCAFMTCNARPSRQEVERLAKDVAQARAMRTAIDYETPALNLRLRTAFIAGAEADSQRRLGRGLTEQELQRVLGRYPGDV
jgi:hypothetical protein